jgi:methionyl aminopeptidase
VSLTEGDLVSVDFACFKEGFCADGAETFFVGRASGGAQRLVSVTREALWAGIGQARAGKRVGDIGAAIQRHVEAAGFSVVRTLVGHGVGRALHEEPQVPNFGRAGVGARLEPGMVLAIEPMVNWGRPEVVVQDDGWSVVTKDGSLSAHIEHTVAITVEGAEVLTRLRRR